MLCEMAYMLHDYGVRREAREYEDKSLRCNLFFMKPDIFIAEIKCLGLGPVQGQKGTLGEIPSAVTTFMGVVAKDKEKIGTLEGKPPGMAVVIIPKFWGSRLAKACESQLSAMGFSPVIGLAIGTQFDAYTSG